MSTTNYLRLGLIFTVTGIIVLAHYLLTTSGGHLPRGTELIVGIMLVVLGIPPLVAVVRRR